MKDKTILAWANKMLRALPAAWQESIRIPQYKPEEALDEVTKAFNKFEAHIRHMESQTREELAELLKGSIQKTLDKAQADLTALREESDAKDITIEELKEQIDKHQSDASADAKELDNLRQRLQDADMDIANLRNDIRHLGG